LSLVDLDHVSVSNINRQIHALDVTLGQAKAVAMCERIAGFHPGCVVDVIDEFVTPDNWPQLLQGSEPTALIDACDQ
ncbi:tRNA threonylcarbamoyladenosine dehydratase, partial [Citrobacter sp. AAK_AS5]